MSPIELKYEDVVDNAALAYEEGRLQAQVDDVSIRGRYAGPCAIGVSLTPEEQKYLDSMAYSTIDHLFDAEEVVLVDTTPSREEMLRTIQAAHDMWLQNRRITRGDSEEKFKKTLEKARKLI